MEVILKCPTCGDEIEHHKCPAVVQLICDAYHEQAEGLRAQLVAVTKERDEAKAIAECNRVKLVLMEGMGKVLETSRARLDLAMSVIEELRTSSLDVIDDDERKWWHRKCVKTIADIEALKLSGCAHGLADGSVESGWCVKCRPFEATKAMK